LNLIHLLLDKDETKMLEETITSLKWKISDLSESILKTQELFTKYPDDKLIIFQLKQFKAQRDEFVSQLVVLELEQMYKKRNSKETI